MAGAKGAAEWEIGGQAVRVTSLDRPMWAGKAAGLRDGSVVTKGDLLSYYAEVAPALLGAVGNRPTTLQRFTRGVIVADHEGESFFNKHLPKSVPDFVDSAVVTFPSGRTAHQVCPRDAATIVWAANLGCVTFHPWPVRCDRTEEPDELRLDLDPQPGTSFGDVVEAALALREVLESVGLEGFVKTSGGRGVHVFCAIHPQWEFLDVRHAAIAIGRALERQLPDLVTTAWWKEERGARIFVDYNQMARDRTMASAWSLRPLPGAPVSMPLTWADLATCTPGEFTIRTVPDLLSSQGNPWADLGSSPGSLHTALEWWQADITERGLGEMPFPPDYPKMPGEPPRVQPSKRRNP